MKSEMMKCDVHRLIEKLCNDNCPDWINCPIAKMIRIRAIALFANYNPNAKKTD